MPKAEGFDLGAMLAELEIGPDLGTGREQIEYIDISLLDDDPNNFYELRDLDKLADNISLCGLQQPIRVRNSSENPNRYIIVSGHRRRAALELLAKEDSVKWSEAPCIVERHDVSPNLQQLRLIYANSSTRTLTPAELSEQAVQVEKLLYQLKEEGYEFPGRMRDHVAQAVNASKSKLSRLKVIRENLNEVWRLSFKVGKLNESAAYALAKLPAEWQRVIYYGVNDKSMGGVCGISEITVENYRKCFEQIKDIKCPVYDGLCGNRRAMMERSVRTAYIWNACKGCCLDCDDLAKCGCSCFHADDKKRSIKQQRKAEIAEKKEASKAQAEADEDLIAVTCNRAREAREKANVEAKDLLRTADMNPLMDKFYTDHETGKSVITKNTGLAYLNQVTVKAARQLLAVSDRLGCSIDWLLGREGYAGPGEMQNAECKMQNVDDAPTGWQTGTPDEPGRYAVLTRATAGSSTLFADDRLYDGCEWELVSYSDCEVVYWMPMPED